MGTDRSEGVPRGGDVSCDAALSTSDDTRPWAQRSAITPAMVNVLPEPLRRYVHDLETRCDPAGDIQTIGSLTEQRAGLLEQVRELQGELAAWRTLALGYQDVPGMEDDIEEDAQAIARLKEERVELVALRSAEEDRRTFTLAWDESGSDAWLILRAGPFAVRVAYIEVYSSDKTASAFLYSWTVAPDDAWVGAHPDPAHEDGGPSKWAHSDYGAIEIPCRSGDEAEAVIRALLAVRNVDVPPRAPRTG